MGEGGGVAGSSRDDRRSRSLERLVRRCGCWYFGAHHGCIFGAGVAGDVVPVGVAEPDDLGAGVSEDGAGV